MGDVVGLNSGVYQTQRGKGINIQSGTNSGGTMYIIDEVNVSEIQQEKPVHKKKKWWWLFGK